MGGVPGYGKYFMGQVWCLIVSIPDLSPLSGFDYQSCFVCSAWQPKVSPQFLLMLLLFQSSGLCVKSPSIMSGVVLD